MRNLYKLFFLFFFFSSHFAHSQDSERVHIRGGHIYNASGEIFHAPSGIVFSKGGKFENLGKLSVGEILENQNDAGDDALVSGTKSKVYFVGKKAEVKNLFQFQDIYTTLTDTLLLDNSKENEVKGRFYIEDKVTVTSDPGLNIKASQIDGKGQLYLPADDKDYSQLITTVSQPTASDIKMEHYYPASGWYWVGFPTSPNSLDNFKRGGTIIKNRSAYVYNASNGFYQPIDETYGISNTEGTRLYFGTFNGKTSFFNPTITPLAPLKRGVIDVVGQAHSGHYTYAAEYNAISSTISGYPVGTPDANKLGWNLIANPYPSTLDWRKVSRGAFVTEAVYTTNMKTGMISSYVDGLYTNEGSPYVAPFSAFLVRAIGKDVVDLDLPARTFGDNKAFKSSPGYDVIKVKVRSIVYPDIWDDFVVAFRNGATDNYDIKYDALKVFNPNTESHNIYTGSSDKRKQRDAYYAINVLQKKQQALVPVYFTTSTSTVNTGLSSREYEISADLSQTNAAWTVKLEDLSTGEVYDMRSITPYVYSYTISDASHRFNLLINTDEEETSNKSLDNVTVWTDTDGIHIYMKQTNNLLLSELYDVKVYNTSGAVIHEMQISPGMDYIFKPPAEGLTRTVYILKITVGQTTKVHRAIY